MQKLVSSYIFYALNCYFSKVTSGWLVSYLLIFQFLGSLVDKDSSIRSAARKILKLVKLPVLKLFKQAVDALLENLETYPQVWCPLLWDWSFFVPAVPLYFLLFFMVVFIMIAHPFYVWLPCWGLHLYFPNSLVILNACCYFLSGWSWCIFYFVLYW